MITSRLLTDLLPLVQSKCKAHKAACTAKGVELLITCTYRDAEAQNTLFAQGRTAPGRVVTNARGGQSLHNFRLAYDLVPLRGGKPVWSTDNGPDMDLWQLVGALGKAQGLEWAGDWPHFTEFPHFQFTGGFTLAQIQAGQVPIERRDT